VAQTNIVTCLKVETLLTLHKRVSLHIHRRKCEENASTCGPVASFHYTKRLTTFVVFVSLCSLALLIQNILSNHSTSSSHCPHLSKLSMFLIHHEFTRGVQDTSFPVISLQKVPQGININFQVFQ